MVETLTNKQENGLYKTESRLPTRAVLLWHAATALQTAGASLDVPQQMQRHTICGEYREKSVTKHDGSIIQDCDGTAAACTGSRDEVYDQTSMMGPRPSIYGPVNQSTAPIFCIWDRA